MTIPEDWDEATVEQMRRAGVPLTPGWYLAAVYPFGFPDEV
jgi:hypothetical protein